MKSSDLISLFEQSLKGINQVPEFSEKGVVLQVGDNICIVQGLNAAFLGELLLFDGGNKGIVFELSYDIVSVFLMYNSIKVSEQEGVLRTGKVFKVPVSSSLLGRVVDAQVHSIDMNGDILAQEEREIEREIPSIIERDPINESLETGILSIDALIPIGKGQRELIIGSRATGKTTTLLDIILHQQNKEVICVYVAIGQRQANVARFVNILHENDAMKYSVVVSASAEESVLYKYLAPYVGTTIAEYFRDQKKDVLIMYDDLSNHAIAYREMSLLLRRAPGREAYPGDIFYLHSRLLERAGKLKTGGSITALPVVQIQGEDIAAYVPTNLISITDGQLYFDQKLFNNNIRPAINTELSVSRVGGAAQTNAIKKMTKALRLQLAQYHELAAFAQFGADLDLIAQHQLERGKRVIEILKQPQHVTFDFIQQSLQLFLLKEGLLDNIPLPKVTYFARQFTSYVESVYPDVVEIIKTTKDISDNERKQLKTIAIEFSTAFST